MIKLIVGKETHGFSRAVLGSLADCVKTRPVALLAKKRPPQIRYGAFLFVAKGLTTTFWKFQKALLDTAVES